MGIDMIKIRAEISIGSSFKIKTPYILSFNVNKQRGQISTFSANLKVGKDKAKGIIAGGSIKIKAGKDSASNTIFSGKVQKATISPCFDDPSYVMMNLSGADILSTLQGKKYSRRSTATESAWASIDSVTRTGYRGSKFAARLVKNEKIDILNTKVNPGAETAQFLENKLNRADGRNSTQDQPNMKIVAIPQTKEGDN